MISYNTENVKMPKLGKRETNAWIKAVATKYGKKIDIISVDLLCLFIQRKG